MHLCYQLTLKFKIISSLLTVSFDFSITFLVPVFECQLSFFRPIRCPSIRLNNGRIRLRSGGRIARVSCSSPFKLVRGKETITCVDGEWDSEAPFCASKFNFMFILGYPIRTIYRISNKCYT